MTTSPSIEPLEIIHRGLAAIVRRNNAHPEAYLWIDVDEKRFFLGVLVPGMTRGAVKAMAERWLEEHSGC